MATIVVHNPVREQPAVGLRTAARREPLAPGQARLVLVDNGKPRAKELLRLVGDGLTERLGLASVTLVSKPSTALALTPEEAKGLAAEYDLVVTGLGDCGACSTGSVEDALTMESLGVPSVAVVSEPFQGLAAAVCRRMGFAGQPFVVVRHPVSTLDDERLAALVSEALAPVTQVLTTQP